MNRLNFLWRAFVVMTMMIVMVNAAGECYEITNKKALENCEEISCESVFCGSREEWLWACSGSYQKWWCNPYKKRELNEGNVTELLVTLQEYDWSYELQPSNATKPPAVGVVANLTEFVDLVVNPDNSDGLINGESYTLLDERADKPKKNCMRACTSLDNLQKHCQKNGINALYKAAQAACIMACDKKYGNGNTNCKK